MTYRSNDQQQVEFECLASSSEGNAYIVRFPPLPGFKTERNLMIECGLPIKELETKAMAANVLLKDIYACIVTHRHNDHSASIKDLMNRGMRVYANSNTIGELLTHSMAKQIEAGEFFEPIPGIMVYAFATEHDVPSLGFIINDQISNSTIAFINDTHTFDATKFLELKIDFLFIECNHIRKQLETVISTARKSTDEKEKSKLFKYTRQRDYHLSLAGTKKMIREMFAYENLRAIFLMHLSTEMANAFVMRNEIEKTFKIRTYICGKNGGIQ